MNEKEMIRKYIVIFLATPSIADSIIKYTRECSRHVGTLVIGDKTDFHILLRFHGGSLSPGDLKHLVKGIIAGKIDWPLLKITVDKVLEKISIEKTMNMMKKVD